MQQRIKGLKVIDESGEEVASEMPEIPSSIPFLPYVVRPETEFFLFFEFDPKKSSKAIYIFFISIVLMMLRDCCV